MLQNHIQIFQQQKKNFFMKKRNSMCKEFIYYYRVHKYIFTCILTLPIELEIHKVI